MRARFYNEFSLNLAHYANEIHFCLIASLHPVVSYVSCAIILKTYNGNNSSNNDIITVLLDH